MDGSNKQITSDDPQDYLAPGIAVDSDHPAVAAYARKLTKAITDPKAQAIALFYDIRDRFIYDPYNVSMTPEGFRASTCVSQGHGFCINKAILLAAACRALGIPARLGFADVRNHLTSAKLRAAMGGDNLFVFHGYAEIYLNGAWRKATPAFNLSLCEKAGILPLDFDGENDSIYHPFDAQGNKHMEYVRQRGVYFDMPLEEMRDAVTAIYGADMAAFAMPGKTSDDHREFEREVEAG